MAGRRKIIPERNYDELIAKSEEKIEKLTQELKDEKAYCKKLKSDKKRFEEQKAEEKVREQQMKIFELLQSSGKSIEEIEAFLTDNQN